jgi:hypothetical protein
LKHYAPVKTDLPWICITYKMQPYTADKTDRKQIHVSHVWPGFGDSSAVLVTWRPVTSYKTNGNVLDLNPRHNCELQKSWARDCSLMLIFHLYYGENKLHSMKWKRCRLCTRSIRLVEFHSASSLKQQSAGRYVIPLALIILIPSKPVFGLTL